jgi:hypothetical protein
MNDEKPRDLTTSNQTGDHIETRQVGYYPDDHPRWPGSKASWILLCTVKGAEGPYTERRIVNYGTWQRVP